MRTTTRLRQLISAGSLVVPGAFNAITALIARDVGYSAVYVSGATTNNGVAGLPDIGMLSMTEMVQTAGYVAAAVPDLPVIADVDTGFGGLFNAARTIREYEKAGLAAVHMEDQIFPKRCGHLPGKSVVPVEEMCAKIRAAVDARQDPDFMIIARTDARAVNGLEDAIERSLAYVEAGADMVFPDALTSAEEFAAYARGIGGRAPCMANMTEFGQTPYMPSAEFFRMGYAMVIYPVTTFRVMMKAVRDALVELKETDTQVGFLDKMLDRKELYRLVGYKEFENLDLRLSRGEKR
ncbi:MAG: methylisocitrate lyase [Bacillota bacterium]